MPHYYYQNYQQHYNDSYDPYFPYYQQLSYRQYPPIDPGKFMVSAKNMKNLMNDASLLLAKMAGSRRFSLELMSSAQAADQKKIENMIKSTGVVLVPDVKYTPDGLILTFESGDKYQECCSLKLNLRWQ